MSHPIHHQHKRKRIHLGHEIYPHQDQLKAFLDKVVYLFGIIIPIFTLPQAIILWSTKDSTGVSMITWASHLLNGLVWLFYGILHKEKPIIFTWVPMTVINGFIVVGIAVF